MAKETFRDTMLRLLEAHDGPINFDVLAEELKDANPTKSARPERIYRRILRRMAKDGLVELVPRLDVFLTGKGMAEAHDTAFSKAQDEEKAEEAVDEMAAEAEPKAIEETSEEDEDELEPGFACVEPGCDRSFPTAKSLRMHCTRSKHQLPEKYQKT